MAKLIEFYVPESFRNLPPEVPPEDRGKVIEFRPRDADVKNVDRYKHQIQLKLQRAHSRVFDVPSC